LVARGSDVRFKAVPLALVLLALAGQEPGNAQALAGAYALFLQTNCQSIISGPATLTPGGSSNSVGTAVFAPNTRNPSAGTVSIDETVIGGPTVSVKSGTVVSSPTRATVAYSNTATTLTIKGITYNAVYSNTRNGVALQVFFNGVLSEGSFANACAAFGTLRAAAD
jgi:hypothetical protein